MTVAEACAKTIEMVEASLGTRTVKVPRTLTEFIAEQAELDRRDRIGSIDAIVDAMEAAKEAAENVMHIVNIHISPLPYITVESLRDLGQVPGEAERFGCEHSKVYRGVRFICYTGS